MDGFIIRHPVAPTPTPAVGEAGHAESVMNQACEEYADEFIVDAIALQRLFAHGEIILYECASRPVSEFIGSIPNGPHLLIAITCAMHAALVVSCHNQASRARILDDIGAWCDTITSITCARGERTLLSYVGGFLLLPATDTTTTSSSASTTTAHQTPIPQVDAAAMQQLNLLFNSHMVEDQIATASDAIASMRECVELIDARLPQSIVLASMANSGPSTRHRDAIACGPVVVEAARAVPSTPRERMRRANLGILDRAVRAMLMSPRDDVAEAVRELSMPALVYTTSRYTGVIAVEGALDTYDDEADYTPSFGDYLDAWMMMLASCRALARMRGHRFDLAHASTQLRQQSSWYTPSLMSHVRDGTLEELAFSAAVYSHTWIATRMLRSDTCDRTNAGVTHKKHMSDMVHILHAMLASGFSAGMASSQSHESFPLLLPPHPTNCTVGAGGDAATSGSVTSANVSFERPMLRRSSTTSASEQAIALNLWDAHRRLTHAYYLQHRASMHADLTTYGADIAQRVRGLELAMKGPSTATAAAASAH